MKKTIGTIHCFKLRLEAKKWKISTTAIFIFSHFIILQRFGWQARFQAIHTSNITCSQYNNTIDKHKCHMLGEENIAN